MRELLEKYYLYLKNSELGKTTYKGYKSDLNQFNLWCIENFISSKSSPFPTFNQESALGYRKFLIECKLPSSTINRKLSSIRGFYKFLADNNLLEVGYTRGLFNLQTNKKSEHPFVHEFSKHLSISGLSKNTIKNYIVDVKLFLKKAGPDPNEITRENLLFFENYLASSFNRSTVRRRMISVRKFLNWISEQNSQIPVMASYQPSINLPPLYSNSNWLSIAWALAVLTLLVGSIISLQKSLSKKQLAIGGFLYEQKEKSLGDEYYTIYKGTNFTGPAVSEPVKSLNQEPLASNPLNSQLANKTIIPLFSEGLSKTPTVKLLSSNKPIESSEDQLLANFYLLEKDLETTAGMENYDEVNFEEQSFLIVNNLASSRNTEASGRATIPTSQSEIKIENSSVTDSSLIYITPTSDTQNSVLYVKEQGEGYFKVGLGQPLEVNVNFNWLINKDY